METDSPFALIVRSIVSLSFSFPFEKMVSKDPFALLESFLGSWTWQSTAGG